MKSSKKNLRPISFLLSIILLVFSGGKGISRENESSIQLPMKNDTTSVKSGYANVNGIKMYYEVYGEGKPLVLIHGGGSTIQSSFGRIIPQLAEDVKLIAVELQNHGRSGFRNEPETFEQDADDVTTLLKTIGIDKASFFGFSNGGTTALQIAIHQPKIVENLVLASAAYKREGLIAGFFEGMQQVTFKNMPAELKTAFLEVNPDTAKLHIMFQKDRDRMINFKDISDQQIRSVMAPTLILNADKDVVKPEQAIDLFRLLPNARLTILPGIHGEYLGEITTMHNGNPDTALTLSLVKRFLDNSPPEKNDH